MFRFIASLIASVALICACTVALGASLAQAERLPRAVSLSDARSAPDMLRYVLPGRSVESVRQCGPERYYSEISAYRWDGSALSAQRWNAMRDRIIWPDRRGGRVIFDGVKWHNGTSAPVLIAGWCN